MAANSSRAAVFLVLNILLFTVVSSCTSPPGDKTPASLTKTKTPNTNTSTSTSTSTNSSTSSNSTKCSMDMVRLGVCLNVLNGLVNVTIGSPTTVPCCSVIGNLLALEVAACVCLNVQVGLLYDLVKVDIPLKVNVLLDRCSQERNKDDRVPKNYQCAI